MVEAGFWFWSLHPPRPSLRERERESLSIRTLMSGIMCLYKYESCWFPSLCGWQYYVMWSWNLGATKGWAAESCVSTNLIGSHIGGSPDSWLAVNGYGCSPVDLQQAMSRDFGNHDGIYIMQPMRSDPALVEESGKLWSPPFFCKAHEEVTLRAYESWAIDRFVSLELCLASLEKVYEIYQGGRFAYFIWVTRADGPKSRMMVVWRLWCWMMVFTPSLSLLNSICNCEMAMTRIRGHSNKFLSPF